MNKKHYAFVPFHSNEVHFRRYTDDERIIELIRNSLNPKPHNPTCGRLIILPFNAEENFRHKYVSDLLTNIEVKK